MICKKKLELAYTHQVNHDIFNSRWYIGCAKHFNPNLLHETLAGTLCWDKPKPHTLVLWLSRNVWQSEMGQSANLTFFLVRTHWRAKEKDEHLETSWNYDVIFKNHLLHPGFRFLFFTRHGRKDQLTPGNHLPKLNVCANQRLQKHMKTNAELLRKESIIDVYIYIILYIILYI